MSALVAGIDIATADARVSVVDAEGAVVASGAAALATPRRPAPGRAEQDARSWWPAVCAALRQATGALGERARTIVAVTPTATSGTFVLVGSDGLPIGPALLYDDARAATQAQHAQELGEERWRACALHIAPSFALAKLAWLAEAGMLTPGVRAWGAADLVVAGLTGEAPRTDWSHALKTGYDLVRREWPHDVLERLGIPAATLPEVAPPGTPAGVVAPAAARASGLPAGCEVRLGMTDSCTAQLACGASARGDFVSVLGTTLVLKGVSARLVHDPSGVVYSHRHPDGAWLPGGASNTGGEALAVRFRGRDLRALDAAAARRGPAGVLAYPLARAGERFPFLAAQSRGFAVGRARDEVEEYRAILDGVAFVERLAYDHLASLGAPASGTLATAGAASASVVWNRIRATVLGRAIVVAANPRSSFGAAVLAAAGSIHGDLAAATAAMVRTHTTIEPDAREAAALAGGYLRFVEELATRGWIAPTLAAAARERASGA